jgi:hypothetical protein
MPDNREQRRTKKALEKRGIEATPDVVQNLLDTRNAAARIGVSPITLERWRVTGEGPIYAKLGKAVRYRPSDLDNWVASKLVTSTSEAA